MFRCSSKHLLSSGFLRGPSVCLVGWLLELGLGAGSEEGLPLPGQPCFPACVPLLRIVVPSGACGCAVLESEEVRGGAADCTWSLGHAPSQTLPQLLPASLPLGSGSPSICSGSGSGSFCLRPLPAMFCGAVPECLLGGVHVLFPVLVFGWSLIREGVGEVCSASSSQKHLQSVLKFRLHYQHRLSCGGRAPARVFCAGCGSGPSGWHVPYPSRGAQKDLCTR